ncbi:MAG TPA: hypothetical protein VGH38_25235 [Bryobacteraceae bacterium]
MPTDSSNQRICKVCLVQHDDEIHAATVSVHGWFHDQVTQGFYDDPEDQVELVSALPEFQVA